MVDFLRYVFEEVRSNRLPEADALELLLQFRGGPGPEPFAIHPLLHRNTSDLNGQRYSSTFTGAEFFFSDHIVHGRKVLPGAAHLEMARAAAQHALGDREADVEVNLADVAFIRPVVMGREPLDVHIALQPQEDGAIAFEIYGGAREEPVVYSRGRAVLARSRPGAVIDPESVIVPRGAERSASAEECYARFARTGLAYASAFKVLTRVQAGLDASGRPVAVGELSLPPAVADTRDSYVLHPSLVDGALQTSVAFTLAEAERSGTLALPFAVERVEVLAPLQDKAWVVARATVDSGTDAAVQKLDIDVADGQGRVCVRLQGFSRRVLEGLPAAAEIETLLFTPRWTPEPVPPPSPNASQHAVHWAVLCDIVEGAEEAIAARMPEARCIRLTSDAPTLAARYTAHATQLLDHLQAILAGTPEGPVLLQLVVPAQGDGVMLRGLGGLLRSASHENPKLIGQVVSIEGAGGARELAARVHAEAGDATAREVRYAAGERHVLRLEEVPRAPDASFHRWRDGGVYLITGGAGGLGLTVAEAIARQARHVTLVLAGRSALSAATEERLEGLRRLGAQAEYRAVDVSDPAAVVDLVAHVTHTFGALHGVIHAAGVIRDSFLLKKSHAELRDVFAPKVAGLVALDEATAGLPLECFVVFSSAVAVTGNVGQGDYAAANAFMDAYAAHRHDLVDAGGRRGLTLSVNWPLWADGGMHVEAGTRERMWRSAGLAPLETGAGLHALSEALQLPAAQVVVLAGDAARIRRRLLAGHEPAQVAVASPAGTVEVARDVLHAGTVRHLARMLSQSLGLPVERIDARAPLELYGIDSVMVMELLTVLEETFGPLSKTLFFEYQTIEQLTGYFLHSHRARLVELLRSDRGESIARPAAPADAEAPAHAPPLRRRAGHLFQERRDPVPGPGGLDIAIIGLSGRYPKADTLQEYWANLSGGVQCVTEVPRERWDHSLYFDEHRDTPGKSYSKWGGFIDGVDRFDPLFFNISPRAAAAMDPQERLFLQCVYAALEDAGYTRESVGRRDRETGRRGSVGVFVGVMYEEYQLYGAQAQALGQGFALAGNASSIANRVSYFCDFHGPSLAVDTMCSSSLTAIHLAIQGLMRGDCDVAIAGGVNLTIHPNKYVALGQGQFVSSDGLCRSFGAGGDGYVPGEGVGAVLLKPLRAAVAAGDHIYGVIKGSAINHGGKTNGYTVPNPHAQADVIAQALAQAGIHPRAVSYVEAHGTGTALGDPIEIAGLAKAFAARTADTQYCAIGSVKSNIGHCESAAGMAGLTKVLLQLQHETLVPSLHAAVLNPHIDFERSPFVVQRALAPWRRPVLSLDGREREYPRIAGLSSFGAGGANAHLIVEEYIGPPRVPRARTRPVVVVLSAKTEDRLRAQVAQLVQALDAPPLQDADLEDLAYTLQVGREALDVRMACVVRSLAALKTTLAGYLAGDTGVEALYRGDVKRHKEALASFTDDDDQQRALQAWVAKGKLARLADVWVKGLAIDWAQLYGEGTPRRISLPTYPFARERCWVEDITPAARPVAEASSSNEPRLHPLLHRNTSSLTTQRFSSTFTGEEFFLRDHVVQGHRVLPGAVYLELARAAVMEALEAEAGSVAVRLDEIEIMRPIVVRSDPRTVHIALHPDASGGVAYEVYTEVAAGEPTVHAQGRASLVAADRLPVLDVESIRKTCGERTLTAGECYEAFSRREIAYGPTFQSVERLHGGGGQVLGRLTLPRAVADMAGEYLLHPSLLDGAFQASAGLIRITSDAAAAEPCVLFALDSVEVLRSCGTDAWVWIRDSENGRAREAVQSLDIDLCDADGNVCVRMRGAAYRRLAAQPAAEVVDRAGPTAHEGEITLASVWDVVVPGAAAMWPKSDQRVALVGGSADQVGLLRRQYPDAYVMPAGAATDEGSMLQAVRSWSDLEHVVWIVPSSAAVNLIGDEMILAQQHGALQGFRMIKALLAAGYGVKPLGLTVVTRQAQAVATGDEIHPAHAGVHGLVGSLAREYANWQVRIVDVPATGEWPLVELLSLPPQTQGSALAYRNGQWFRQQWLPCTLPRPSTPQYRKDGVYVILGGAGGLGEVVSEYLIGRYHAQVVWIGRRLPDEHIARKQERLRALGPPPYYVTADATDRAALHAACDEIKARFGEIHGVIVSIVGPLDESLARMGEERFRTGLAAKVDVSVRMAQVFGREPLDVVIVFSSLGAFEKPGGMSSYAAGCVFQDTFFRALARDRSYPVKVVNWGYWGDVGIGEAIPQALKTRLKLSGSGSIEPVAAMAALERLLGSPLDHVAYLKTTGAAVLPGEGAIADERLSVAPGAPAIVAAPAASTTLAFPDDTDAVRQGEAFEALLGKVLFGQLSDLGLFARMPTDVAAWKQAVKLPPLYDRWLEQSLRALQALGYLSEVLRPATFEAPDMTAVWAEWNAYSARGLADDQQRARILLADATLRALPAILTGARPATDVLFPDASMTLVEGIYTHNRVADYFNAVLAETLVACLDARLRQNAQARLRLIEIGAGTGGTSAALFERLAPYASHLAEYCYTDVSKAFLLHAEEHYAPTVPYLTTRLFDVEQPLAGQGLTVGTYDVAIATNVLHATRDMRRTLRNAKALLKGRGVLLINEIAGRSLFTHLTFGLLPGWWLYEDAALRLPGSPALEPETWRRLLTSEGFAPVWHPAQALHERGQQIVAAQSDGVVRQANAAGAAPARTASQVRIGGTGAARSQVEVRASTDAGADVLRDKATAYLKKVVAQTLRMSPEQLDASEPLETYGIDSILVVQITNALRGAFENVSSTLLFEHQTIEALANHLLLTEREALIRHVEQTEGTTRDGGGREAVLPTSKPTAGRFLSSRARVTDQEPPPAARTQDVAIVGLSGRYPKSATVEEFWQRLHDGENCIREVPSDRWEWRAYYGEEKGRWGTIYSKWGGFVDDIACFDPLYFNISPREAQTMDPQERLFLQEAHACVADAGYTPATLCASRQVGVFVGVTNGSYRRRALYWSIANRVSSLFGLHGPSLAVDTACSASLTAIHLACESLHSGRSECAIAGGVNIIVDATQYMGLSAMTMLSGGDECRAFGANADGFVDAEGVGAVLLKPLRAAVAAGDHIYGVIKGSAINHGGKTNGYTVPNPHAQAEVIAQALAQAGIHPRAVSYVEAHGTGTALGDPIEIAGLAKAFAAQTADTQYCAIGSVKSNIGHCESAAGMAGLTKVLLQLQHETLVPSLHAAVLNPHIDFERSPFVVQRALAPWRRPVLSLDGREREYPRIAGLSSFGAGGANAHLIVEEYIGPSRVPTPMTRPVVVVLSAKTEDRLRAQVAQLMRALDAPPLRDADLEDLAYTLQVGREALDVRLACVVGSLAALKTTLAGYLAGDTGVEALYRGDVKRHKEALASFTGDDDQRLTLQAWVAKGKLAKLADVWVKGLAIDWAQLYGEATPRRISLPTYPFARERYWAVDIDTAARNPPAGSASSPDLRLHPLLHRNTSDLGEQRFSSTFTGDEFFFADHVVRGQRVLPAAAQLELARAAAIHSAQKRDARLQVCLENVVFLRPVVAAEQRVDLHIALEPLRDGAIGFEIYGDEGTDREERAVHTQGRAVLVQPDAAADIDLNALEGQCTPTPVEARECYARFAQMGLAYGPAFKALQRLRTGRDTSGQILVLGELQLPEVVAKTRDAYVLHPSVLDAALQASLGLALGTGAEASGTPALPFAVERVDVLAPLQEKAWVVVRPNAHNISQGTVRKLDLDITDARGRVCVLLKGFSSRVAAEGPTVNRTSEVAGELTLAPVWEVVSPEVLPVWPGAHERVAIVGGGDEQQRLLRGVCPHASVLAFGASDGIREIERQLSEHAALEHVVWIAPSPPRVALTGEAFLSAQHDGVLQGFRLIKALLAGGYGSQPLGLTVVTGQAHAVAAGDEIHPAHAGIHGLVGSLAKEYANWRVRLVDLPATGEWPVDALLSQPAQPQGNALTYRDGEWFRQRWLRCTLPDSAAPAYRRGGVYVILGGAGGLGEVFSEYLIGRYQAQVVWIGRRLPDEHIARKQDRLRALGPAPHYIAADATNRAALHAACEEIKARFGAIHGIVHATIVLKDQGLARMDEATFAASWRAKADVAVHLADVFAHEPLDFVLFFSALQSLIKAPGQSNYAAGCTFTDAYAHALRRAWSCPVKVVNWGYWGSAGIVASDDYRVRMAQLGFDSIEPAAAMAALERLLLSPVHQVAYLKTTGAAVLPALSVSPEEAVAVTPDVPAVLSRLPARTALTPPVDDDAVNRGKALEALLGKLLFGHLRNLGLLERPSIDVAAWKQPVRLPGLYERWLEQSLRVLHAQGYLTREGGSLRVGGTMPPLQTSLDEWEVYKSQSLTDDRQRAAVALADATLRALPAILKGERAATEVLFPDASMALVEGIYTQNRVADYFNAVLAETLLALVEARVEQDPRARLRLIEIGAGTGGTSARVFEGLAAWAAHIAEYAYTDISRAFLVHGHERYASTAPNLTTALFDIEQPVAVQGLEPGAYDVALATNVLHATRDVRQTLRNAKALLKRHGVLLINEMTDGSLFTHLTFGLLPGWWLYQDAPLRVPGSPALAPRTWRRVLAQEGFAPVAYPAEAFHDRGQQIIAAQSDGVVRQASAAPRAPAHASRRAPALVQPRPLAPSPRKAERRTDAAGSHALEAHVRQAIRDSIAEAIHLEHGRIQDDCAFSEYGVDSIVAVALVNTVNSRLGLALNTTALFDYGNVDQLVGHIVREHSASVTAAVEQASPNVEDPARDAPARPTLGPSGSRGRRRFLDTRDENRGSAGDHAVGAAAVERPQDSDERPIYHRVIVDRPGAVDDLRIGEDAIPRLQDDDVLVSVRAFSLNFGDVLCVRGLYPGMPAYPLTPGVEVSGIVVDVGASVRTVSVGDPVVAMVGPSMGAHATAVVCPAAQVFTLPAKLSFEEACAVPAVALTMIDAFRKIGLERGERILIQTAAGGTGLIAVQLARHHGAEIYATAGSQRKLDYLRSIGVSNVINYVEADFEEEIRRQTGGTGVDAVINTLPGSALQKGLNCLRPGGRYVEIAMTALKSARSIDLSVLSSNQAFYSIDLRKLLAGRPERLAAYWRELTGLVEQDVIRPTIGRSFPFDLIKDAYRSMGDRSNIGKVVVHIPDEYRFTTNREGNRSTQRASGAAVAVPQDAIAIVGMSGRFARADTLAELWEELAAGRELVEDVSRWPLPPDDDDAPPRCRRGGFLRDIDCFDPLFFNISGLEATYMDPQQRIFLEEAWKALEDAGAVGAGIAGTRCGVYVGCTGGDYRQLFDDTRPAQAFWGNTASVIPARIAYYLDLQGPAIAIDTACSSSLVAIHVASQGLRARETDLAIAGGVFVQSTPGFYGLANQAGMLSPSGRCHAFDARADGFVPGEGVGVVVLKRLSDAEADGDHIYGVIRGSGLNQDGTTNGITAPSARSQERLERQVYDTFGIHPEEIQLVEAHGTGTTLGDPIEYRALTQAFGRDTDRKSYCAIGSIKTNIGHAAAAAGVAGVIKVLLALEHRQIPPSLNYETGNPHIDFENSPFYVNTRLRAWEAPDGRRRCAAVSSFGMSGTNAHLVIEEAPPPPSSPATPAHLFALSARTAAQLRLQVERLVTHCQAASVDCGHMSYSLLLGRRHFGHRLACVARGSEDLVAALSSWLARGEAPNVYAGTASELREHGSLQRLGNQCIESCRHAGSDAYREQLATVAELYVQGYQLDFAPLFAGESYRRIPLPTYPFARQRYWVAARPLDSETPPAASPDLAGPTAAPAVDAGMPMYDRVRAFMLQELSASLYVPLEQLDPTKPLHEYGLDSVLGLKLVRQLESAFGLTVTGRELLEHSTIDGLALCVAGKTIPAGEPQARPDDAGDGRQEPLEAFKNGEIDLDRIRAMIEQGLVS